MENESSVVSHESENLTVDNKSITYLALLLKSYVGSYIAVWENISSMFSIYENLNLSVLRINHQTYIHSSDQL